MSKIKIAVDFGSAFTNIYMLGSGIVLSEPTVAGVLDGEKNTVKFIGDDAKKIIGKTSKNTKIVFPIFEGDVVNEKVAIELLRGFLNKIGIKPGISGITALFSVPCGTDNAIVSKYKKIASALGITKLYFAEAPLLSAMGQEIPLNDSNPSFVVDISGGITNVAAVTLDGIIAGISINYGINKLTTSLIDYIAENCGLQIGLLSAERLRNEIGCLEEGDSLSFVVNGRDIKMGTPKSVSIKASDIFPVFTAFYDKVGALAMSVLSKLPPEVSAEIRHSGIYISGIGANIYGLEKYFAKKFNMSIHIAENAKYSVVIGGGIALGNSELIKKVTLEYN